MLTRQDIEDSYRLSPLQEGMLYHSLSAGDSGVYIGQAVCKLDPAVDLAAFERAWRAVIRRHAVLRASFRWDGLDEPLQEIHRQAPFCIEKIECSGEPEAAQRLLHDASLAFDLSTAPLMRFSLLTIPGQARVFVWSHHHALLDGRSRAIVLAEVAKVYQADCAGADPDLAPAPAYKSYAGWIRQLDLTASEAYWKKRLAGFAPPPALRLRMEEGARNGPGRWGTCEVDIPEALNRELHAVAQRLKITPNIVVQAAWGVLLSRYLDQRDVMFGNTRACRRTGLEAAKSMAGVLMNTLPVRLLADPARPCLDLLASLREQHVAMRLHEHTPLSKIRDWSGIPARAQLFESIVVFEEHTLDDTLRLDGCSMWQGIRRSAPSHYPLTLAGYNKPSLRLEIDYDRRLFDDAAVERLGGHLRSLIAQIAENPKRFVGDLVLLPAPEREQALGDGRGASARVPSRRVHQLIEEQVERSPEAIAVVCGGARLTYRELNGRANRLARYLRKLGVGANVPVAICLRPSADLAVALLAVLKAGGAYVPVDPSYPAERLQLVLEDAAAPVLLTDRASAGLAAGAQAEVVCLDRDWPGIAGEDAANLHAPVSPDQWIYVIYTSGSTGRPKGAAVYHRGFENLLHWFLRDFQIGAGDRVLLMSSIGFDLTQKNVYAPLVAGGALHLPHAHDPAHILGEIEAGPITLLNCAPSAFDALIEEARSSGFAALRSLRTLFLGGESIPLERLRAWLQSPGCRTELVNTYGPTECSDIAASYRLPRAIPDSAPVPIGGPIPNVKLLVLDRDLQLAPQGIAGELYIAGAGLGAGYVRDRILTAAKFVPDPFSEAPGGRLYRTGDLARWRPGGILEFLGRADHQVKIRGVRIELGEIEAALARHPAVGQAAVVVREDALGGKVLAAYFVARGPEPEPAELRRFVLQSLPAAMAPGFYVALDSLPLNAHGKVDRQALARLNANLPSPDTPEPPRTAAERMLADIWCGVLDLESVGRSADFFALGGHSLLAMRMISRVRRGFRVEMELRELFECSTLAALAEHIEGRARASDATPPAPILPAADGPDAPLSFAQQRLFFLQQYEPESWHYNIPIALRLTGSLQQAALDRAFREILRRHEALRTRFALARGAPVQVIDPPPEAHIPVVSLEAVPEAEREREARHLLAQQISQPFDLSQGPLLRAQLLRSGAGEHVLIVVMHHAICDAWSLEIFARELWSLYGAFSSGRASPLPELPVQYAAYSAWQRAWIEDQAPAAQMDYWKRQLAGAPALELPTSRPRPAFQDHAGARHYFHLPAGLLERLRNLSRQEGVTLFMTMLGAFNALLHRYTGQHDIVIGTPISGRNRVELEDTIGLFLNTLALRTGVSGDLSFRALLGRARDVALQAYAHQDAPFEMLVEALQLRRDPSRTPLFQAMLVLHNIPRHAWRLGGLNVTAEPVECLTAKFDLTLSLAETEAGLRAFFEYRTSLFDPAFIERMAAHLQNLLSAAADDPDCPLSQLPLLDASERRRLLEEYNPAQRAYPDEKCIHELFEAQAARTPESVAIVYSNRSLKYRELNQRANRLAHHLRSLGVGPDTLVGVCLERSLEMIVALLAVLKAGGAYVPLDPNHPGERLALMLDEVQAPVALTQQHLAGRLAPHTAATILALDAGEDWSGRGSANPPPLTVLDNLAYVMYTSGSTGKPKGVSVTHRGIRRLVCDPNYVQFGEREVMLQFAPLAFDLSTFEIWGCLVNGGRLIVYPAQTASIEELGAVLRNHRVTTLWLTAGLFHYIVERRVEDLGGVRQLLAGGDVLQAGPVKRVLEALPGCRMIDGYGPTEVTTFASCHTVTAADDLSAGVPIGSPIDNTRVFVLDAHMELAPVGVYGELYVDGDGLARGYHRQPALTAERFVPHPFAPGARMYRTGDLARWNVRGQLEFLGRRDHQVKIRGYRIEPGEIESALRQHPNVRQAVVASPPDESGDKRLIAYLVCTEPRPATGDLRSFLKDKLPDYMLPSLFIALDALPLSTNGKVDRKALPPPASFASSQAEYVPPRTAAEACMAGIWAEVLKTPRVGLHDDFFALGGHSLLAMRLVSRIRHAFHVELPLRTLFANPTVGALAKVIDERTGAPASCESAGIPPRPRDEEPVLSFNQEGHLLSEWWAHRRQAPFTLFNSFLGLELKGELNLGALEESLNQVIERHEILRTAFLGVTAELSSGQVSALVNKAFQVPGAAADAPKLGLFETGLFKQEICSSAPVKIDFRRLDRLPAGQRRAEALRLAAEEIERPFNYDSAPLVRALLMRLDAGRHLLVIVIHHLVCDGWSLQILQKDIQMFYERNCRSLRPPAPAALPIQYADFARWQRSRLQGAVLNGMASNARRQWIEFESAFLKARDLTFARSPSPGTESLAARESLSLDPALCRRLRTFAGSRRITLHMLFLAGLSVVLHHNTGKGRLAIWGNFASRTRVDLDDLIGWFSTSQVIGLDLSSGPSARALLEQVRDAVLEGEANQELPRVLLWSTFLTDSASIFEIGRAPAGQRRFSFAGPDIWFEMRTDSSPAPHGGGPLTFTPVQLRTNTSGLPLRIVGHDSGDGIEIGAQYLTGLLDGAGVRGLLAGLERTLETILESPDVPISRMADAFSREREAVASPFAI